MTTINAFVENTYTDFDIDEVKVFNDTIKITAHLLEDVDVFSKSCLKDYKFSIISFDIVLCNNEEIHRINKEYRDKDSATDVITFALFADSEPDERFIFDDEINLGEIVVSLDKIKEQSIENNVTFDSELYYLISHGILHLLGFDHQNQVEYDYMVEKQNNAKAVVL
ncbi:rRNA maturation RNase YbeY [bacterium]|nr:rRNA maturation RNase YbeY [bacterium]